MAFAALQGATGDIFVVDIETGDLKNITKDARGDFSPTWTPDGKSIVYLARVSQNDKLFRIDLASEKKTQLTFGTHDDGGAQFLDADTQQELGIMSPEVKRRLAEAHDILENGAELEPVAATPVSPGQTALFNAFEDAVECAKCGGRMIRTGSCYTCRDCGQNTGCS